MKNIFLCLSLIGLLAACSKPAHGPEPPPPPPPPPGGGTPATVAVTEIGQPTGQAIIKTIGTNGGTISSTDGKVVLTIPAGALDKNETISMEPIENKAPLGITGLSYRFLPHGLQFKKPVTLSLKYHDPKIMGTSATELKMATQLSNKTWRRLGNVSVDTNARTIKANLAHFSDYSVYTSYKLEDFKTKTDTAVINLYTSEKVRVRTIEEVELDSALTIPMPAFPIEWAVNGNAQPTPQDGLGGFTTRDGYTMSDRDYNAPRRGPKPDTLAISAKFNFGTKGILYLVRTVVVNDINKMMINGKNYDEITLVATVIPGTGLMALQGFQNMPNGKWAEINIQIENFNAAPGNYTYNASEKVKILVDDEFPIGTWSSERTLLPSGTKEYTGSLQITVTGSLPHDLFFTGKISGNFFGTSGTVNNAQAELKFAIRAD